MRRGPVGAALFVYTLSTLALLLLMFVYVRMQGESWQSFGVAMLMFVPAVVAVGYLILGDLFEHKKRQDQRLEHLLREVLHEINLPVSTIRSNLQMLEVRIQNPHNRKRITRALEALKRLQRLYDEMAYAIRREFHAVETESVDLADVVKERVEQHAEMKRNPFVLELESMRVVLDRIGLEQVLDNLIENAMKYSPADRPIRCLIEGTRLVISDQGKGMDTVQIARVWERYYQADSHHPGEGIGLAFVKRYCDEAGIQIRIESQPGSGTSVTLDFARVMQK